MSYPVATIDERWLQQGTSPLQHNAMVYNKVKIIKPFLGKNVGEGMWCLVDYPLLDEENMLPSGIRANASVLPRWEDVKL